MKEKSVQWHWQCDNPYPSGGCLRMFDKKNPCDKCVHEAVRVVMCPELWGCLVPVAEEPM